MENGLESNKFSKVLETLYSDMGPGLLAYFRGRHDDAALADDLLQDTFFEAARRPMSVSLSRSPKGYLFGIARNLSRKAYRDAVRRPDGFSSFSS